MQRDARKCSCSTPWSAMGFGGPNYPQHPTGLGWGATGPCEGGIAATPLRHTRNCGKSRDGGVATPWIAPKGGVASAPLSKTPHTIGPKMMTHTYLCSSVGDTQAEGLIVFLGCAQKTRSYLVVNKVLGAFVVVFYGAKALSWKRVPQGPFGKFWGSAQI